MNPYSFLETSEEDFWLNTKFSKTKNCTKCSLKSWVNIQKELRSENQRTPNCLAYRALWSIWWWGAAKHLRYFLHPGERNCNFAQNITSCITAYADYNLIKIIKVTIYNPYRCCQLFIIYFILEISLLLLNYFHNALQNKKYIHYRSTFH